MDQVGTIPYTILEDGQGKDLDLLDVLECSSSEVPFFFRRSNPREEITKKGWTL